MQEVAFELEQDWQSVENIELYEQWRNPETSRTVFLSVILLKMNP